MEWECLFPFLKPLSHGYTIESVPGQYDVRPAVVLPAAERHRLLAGAKLYCLVTEAHVCEQLVLSRYMTLERLRVEPRRRWQVQRPNHYITM